ncbi:hypothetical protein WA026_002499 [Henosepilachna vigintioctopunctata]|uniref:VTT domain-containing protein n=1 Tax=Henosepilachna vigintioctopunctata TaxID=420089 RepID=A0AAW1TTN0_9CUCU
MTTITIDEFGETESSEPTKKLIPKSSTHLCYISLWRAVAVVATIVVLISLVLLLRFYMRFLLLWLEHQNGSIQMVAVVLLFCLVALPISIGYLVMYGCQFWASNSKFCIEKIGHHPAVFRLTENPTAQAIKTLISGPSCFKIVLCARVTPIPFGLQNTIFALSNVNPRIYHLASLMGLFPTQVLGVYFGTTLRAMQDAWEHKNLSPSAYIVISIQLVMDGLMMIWVGYKARKELAKVLSGADTTGPIIL